MEQANTTTLAQTILTAPGWAKVGITAPSQTIREAAAQELALQIGKVVGIDIATDDPRQMALPF